MRGAVLGQSEALSGAIDHPLSIRWRRLLALSHGGLLHVKHRQARPLAGDDREERAADGPRWAGGRRIQAASPIAARHPRHLRLLAGRGAPSGRSDRPGSPIDLPWTMDGCGCVARRSVDPPDPYGWARRA